MKYCHAKKMICGTWLDSLFSPHMEKAIHIVWLAVGFLDQLVNWTYFARWFLLVKVGPSLPSPIAIVLLIFFSYLNQETNKHENHVRLKSALPGFHFDLNNYVQYKNVISVAWGKTFFTKYIIAHVLHSNIKYFILHSRGL